VVQQFNSGLDFEKLRQQTLSISRSSKLVLVDLSNGLHSSSSSQIVPNKLFTGKTSFVSEGMECHCIIIMSIFQHLHETRVTVKPNFHPYLSHGNFSSFPHERGFFLLRFTWISRHVPPL
jgi:hypothetical protein